jgi:hypothetical protein
MKEGKRLLTNVMIIGKMVNKRVTLYIGGYKLPEKTNCISYREIQNKEL